MARPSSFPEFASAVAAADTATPPAASRASGWLGGIPPIRTWFNWWMKLVYEWVGHLDSNFETGLLTGKQFKFATSENRWVKWYLAEDFYAYAHTKDDVTGAPALTMTAFRQGATKGYISLTTVNNGESFLYLPLDLPGGIVVDAFTVVGNRNGGGGAIELEVLQADPNSTSRTTAFSSGTVAISSSGGADVVEGPTAVGPWTVANQTTRKIVVRLRLKNNGAAPDTARLMAFALHGYTPNVPASGDGTI